MSNAYVGTATITPDGQLYFDEKVGLPPGRALVRVEILAPGPSSGVHILDLAGNGGPGRSQEEIDTQVAALRNEWAR